MSSDPWAAAQAAPASAPATGAVNPLPFNRDNPFAKPSDFSGGVFTPSAPLDSLVGRTVIYIPRSFNAAAPDPFNVGKTRAQWTADIYVIDGGRLSFFYEQKADPSANPPREAATIEHVHENCTPATPYVMLNSWVSQAAFIAKLNGAAEARQFLICTPTRGAQKAQRQAGQTDETVRATHAAWIARGKAGSEPKFVWIPSDVGPDAMSRAIEWWNAHKDSIRL